MTSQSYTTATPNRSPSWFSIWRSPEKIVEPVRGMGMSSSLRILLTDSPLTYCVLTPQSQSCRAGGATFSFYARQKTNVHSAKHKNTNFRLVRSLLQPGQYVREGRLGALGRAGQQLNPLNRKLVRLVADAEEISGLNVSSLRKNYAQPTRSALRRTVHSLREQHVLRDPSPSPVVAMAA